MTRQASVIRTIQDHASMAVDPGGLQISIFPVPYGTYKDPQNWQGMMDPGKGGTSCEWLSNVRTNSILP